MERTEGNDDGRHGGDGLGIVVSILISGRGRISRGTASAGNAVG